MTTMVGAQDRAELWGLVKLRHWYHCLPQTSAPLLIRSSDVEWALFTGFWSQFVFTGPQSANHRLWNLSASSSVSLLMDVFPCICWFCCSGECRWRDTQLWQRDCCCQQEFQKNVPQRRLPLWPRQSWVRAGAASRAGTELVGRCYVPLAPVAQSLKSPFQQASLSSVSPHGDRTLSDHHQHLDLFGHYWTAGAIVQTHEPVRDTFRIQVIRGGVREWDLLHPGHGHSRDERGTKGQHLGGTGPQALPVYLDDLSGSPQMGKILTEPSAISWCLCLSKVGGRFSQVWPLTSPWTGPLRYLGQVFNQGWRSDSLFLLFSCLKLLQGTSPLPSLG